MLKENKAHQFFLKTTISYPLICIHAYACQGVRNVCFRKIWRAFFPFSTRFEIFPFTLLSTNWFMQSNNVDRRLYKGKDTTLIRPILKRESFTYVRVSGGKKYYWFGKVCVRTNWMTPSDLQEITKLKFRRHIRNLEKYFRMM